MSTSGDSGFFVGAALSMTLLVIAGFSLQLAMGRSSFAAAPIVHAHAIVFMGWVALYLTQNVLVGAGNLALHRRLGWLAAGWVPAMLILGCMVALAIVRDGRVPFFFRPLHFLVFDQLTLLGFAGLTTAAIILRRRTDWHRRLHFCAMTLLLGPAVGRLLPMPFLKPWAFETVFVVTLLFPAAGVLADLRRGGRVHPAWGWGIAALMATLAAIEGVTYGPPGAGLYAAVTAGTPGAALPPLAFGRPPPGVP